MTVFELRIERLGRGLFDGVSAREGEPRHRVDLAILAYFADERPLRGLAALVDWRTAGAVSKLLRSGFCTGRRDEIVLLPGRRDLPTERMVLVGLGLRGELDLDAARQTAVSTVAMALRLQPKEVLFAMPCGGDEREFSEALLAGIVLGLGGELPGAGSQAQGTETQASEADAPQGEVVRAITGPWPAAGEAPEPDEEDGAGDDVGTHVCRWWVVADERHTGRLRRLLEGQPRAAGS